VNSPSSTVPSGGGHPDGNDARALATEDEDVSAIIERELKKVKIKLIAGVQAVSVEQTPEGLMACRLSNGQDIRAEKILVSIGRTLNTDGLRLEDAGLTTGKRGEIPVNDRMETGVPGIYAIGDVTGTLMLAHVASHQGLVAAENALGGDARMDYASVPAGSSRDRRSAAWAFGSIRHGRRGCR